MTEVTDQQLTAFLDGAMDEVEAQAFEVRLAGDPELAARAEGWLANDRRVVAALTPLADAPIGADLLARMGLAETAARAASSIHVAANDNPPWWRRYALPLGGALAASLAAVLLLVPRGGQAPQRDMSFALETGRALHPVKLADGSSVTPTLTVRAADGRYCREFRSDATVGLACRASGRWQIEAQGAGTGPADGATIAVASGADGSALDAAYRKLGASDPLHAKAEAELIAGGWNK